MRDNNVYLGDQYLIDNSGEVKEKFVDMDGDKFYQIENYTQMPPFFMTITSSSNHWMFISSTGGLTAGRVDSDSALFPYYTDDRITENSVNTGPKTIILVTKGDKTFLWKPFTNESIDIYDIKSVLSKNVMGNILKFEEINNTLGLSFSYYWMNSKKHGLVRRSIIKNISENNVNINIVDGFQNLMPSGVETKVQSEFSCLLNGYKRTQLDESGLGLITLSATLTDLAEPSEALRANTVWQSGLDVENYLLDVKQLDKFCHGKSIKTETDEKGERGCYFVQSKFSLGSKKEREWIFVADVDKDLTEVNEIKHFILNTKNREEVVLADVKNGTNELKEILNQNDGLQITEVEMNSVHHQANVLFNIMRGGFFYKSYIIGTEDLKDFIKKTNINVFNKNRSVLEQLEPEMNYNDLLKFILDQKDSGLERLWYEYLPLTFSRRHGDPSRPWNRFSIQTTKADGSAKLDYQGNWRDIFQNWEALCFSYPQYIKHVIGKFLNASTKDGYNPYRVSKDGIDWECPEPGNPWANIGYWSDHQIIYLLKLLEMYKQHNPESIRVELNNKNYTYANVPYQIRTYKEILNDPYETIIFNEEKNKNVKAFAKEIGSEGKMLHDKNGNIVLGSLSEKLMIHLLTKLGNFIPEGGIWMNTQRPEWNDANNALVGKGISVVTLAYIRRYISFMIDLYSDSSDSSIKMGEDTIKWLNSLSSIFKSYEGNLGKSLLNSERFKIVKELGEASEEYRSVYYNQENVKEGEISVGGILEFLKSAIKCVDDSLYKNRREDNLYHSYNTLEIKDEQMIIHNLYEMLEGQVAILTSGLLTPQEADKTFEALRNSSMYREDQNSYMLYPNRELKGFTEKNIVPNSVVEGNTILKELIAKGNKDLITKDIYNQYHFNGSFNNSKQVKECLDRLNIKDDKNEIVSIFDTVFDHQSFTGRSGTFFAYEGLGSIYWHMVSKLLLAAQENLFAAVEKGASKELIESLKKHYYDIRNGIGYNKTADVYGAFPFDPYSHTPYAKGAKQPGMTGQVKEEVITRLAEMGITIESGKMVFNSLLVDDREFLTKATTWSVLNNSGSEVVIELPAKSFAGTHCQTPYIIKKGSSSNITVNFKDGSTKNIPGNVLPKEYSLMIFNKDKAISYLEVELEK
ncbi:hypothetical protein EW093_06795 [Thiospirochaeta perfilievii]|uniref:Glycosyl hydrolase 36 catalytic domain-containing protein n=1 Tax=Thiospirochaeta perfilievii TaxID=252967 RepID=A0A5C1QCM1_9SPIO|nr:hypothetical protein [Thiospirochaeta perfilievii]QEN04416.1 hypothetical protein EW093_06795 [Thiospirochaeta perfilievii]